jgi:hypothetical protein
MNIDRMVSLFEDCSACTACAVADLVCHDYDMGSRVADKEVVH